MWPFKSDPEFVYTNDNIKDYKYYEENDYYILEITLNNGNTITISRPYAYLSLLKEDVDRLRNKSLSIKYSNGYYSVEKSDREKYKSEAKRIKL